LVSSNFDKIDDNHKSNFIALKKKVEKLTVQFSAQISMIGQLQLIRKLVCRQIHFSCKVESSQYYNCLDNLNFTLVNNLQEIKDKAVQGFLMEEGDARLLDNLDGEGQDGEVPVELTPQQKLLK